MRDPSPTRARCDKSTAIGLKQVLRLAARVLAALAAAGAAALVATNAGAIRNGVEVAADDTGGRASVLVNLPGGTCSGLVYGDRFVITAGHCLAEKDLTAAIRPQDVTVTYGRSLKQPNVAVRHATGLLIHENFLGQFRAWLAGKDDMSFDQNPVNHADIGLIRVEDTHPAGALGAALPDINNEYVVCCLARPRSWPLVWLDVYGFGAAPKGEMLHKIRVSTSAPDMVRPGKQPNFEQPYLPRQIRISPDASSDAGAQNAPATCSGDSGGPAFFVTTSRSRNVPRAPIKLIKEQPLAVGIISHKGSPGDCDGTFYLIRLDYYRDWILGHVRLLR